MQSQIDQLIAIWTFPSYNYEVKTSKANVKALAMVS